MSDVLDKPLTTLYQNTVKSGRIPSDWKHGYVGAIFKKGERRKPHDYRPVSLTCIACKIMESIIKYQIMKHIRDNKFLSEKQFQFIDRRSTVLQLLLVLDIWTKIIDDSGTIDCIYCDLKEVFHNVPHKCLLKKPERCGIKGEVLNWIHTSLSDRTQQVIINGESSQHKCITGGVPQGRVLEPLLFVIFMKDLPE